MPATDLLAPLLTADIANPAITLARSLSNSFAGIAPGDVPGFIAAQLVGALFAHQVARALFAEVR